MFGCLVLFLSVSDVYDLFFVETFFCFICFIKHMDQRTLLVEIISLLKDAREKKQSKLYLKMLLQEACTFKFKKKNTV